MSYHAAERPEDLPSQAEVLGMSGLEFMQGVLDGRVSAPPIGKLMNFWMEQVEPGRTVFRGEPEFAACNPIGTVHGGWYGAILDSCMACAVTSMLPKGAFHTTLEYKVNVTRPIPVGTAVLAEGIAQHTGRSTGVATGEIRGVDDGKLYATGSTTCLVMTP